MSQSTQPVTEQESTPALDGYTIFTVFARPAQPTAAPADAPSLAQVVADLAADDVVVRGLYDVSAMRADADLMVWIHGRLATDGTPGSAVTPERLQLAIRQLRRSAELSGTSVVWSAMAVHRDAEFNKAHVPGFLRGIEPRGWLTVYPFVRSYDWYVLPAEDRSRMLADHGRKGAAFTGVVANTISCFALGDYEWLLPMESDQLTDLVDMMRDLRATEARLHVREEVPFYTGRRIGADEVAEVLA